MAFSPGRKAGAHKRKRPARKLGRTDSVAFGFGRATISAIVGLGSSLKPPASSQGSSVYLLFLTATAALAGFLFGFDASVINGTVGALAATFVTSALATGFAVASVLLGSCVGSLVAGQFTDRVGRKPVMLVTAVLFALSATGAGAAGSAAWFFVFRLIGGFGVGAACVVAPAYIAEISPPDRRGRLTTVQQLAIVVGLQCAFVSNFLIAHFAGGVGQPWLFGLAAWRWMFWVQVVPSLLYFFTTLALPESPRFLVARRREAEAARVMARLWGQSAGGEPTLAEIRASVDPSHRPRWRDVLMPGTRRLLPVVWIGIGLAFFQQASGINAVMYFGEVLWRTAGFTENRALVINVALGATLIVATLVSMALVDRIGRRPLLIWGAAVMTLMLALLAAVFLLSAHRTSTVLALTPGQAIATLTAEHIYIFCFGASWGPVVWVLLGEMFPNRVRGSALAVAAAAQWMTNFAVTMSFPWLLQTIGLGGSFVLYALAALGSVAFVWRRVAETKGKTLEEMTGTV
jgi:SP family sugar:H+ symporter-like MFS transporter